MLLRLLGLALGLLSLSAASKYNQRIFEDVAAIDYADPTKNGFRVILSDSFITRHLKPGSLPTIFVTAIPLHPGEPRYTHAYYPEAALNDKLLVKVHNLRAQSWYYVCIEWENINRHNETTGTSCKIYRTLDRFGKTASTAVDDVELTEASSDLLRFGIKYGADFPVRLTAYLTGGTKKAAAQQFVLKERGLADVIFPFLDSGADYGQLCVREEPLVSAYTAMGRLVSGLSREKCYFDVLRTKSRNSLPMATEPARAYRRVAPGSGAGFAQASLLLTSLAALAVAGLTR